jgi:pyruvate dehydrogenase E2 component (dihydrolipoamide acetyltransferase)
MPKFEMSQESATVVEWLKDEGEQVDAGEPVLIVETDKVTMEVEAPATGILAGIRGEPNQMVPVTEIIAYVLQPGEELPTSAEPARLTEARGVTASSSQFFVPSEIAQMGIKRPTDETESAARPGAQPPLAPHKVRATPAARRIAREKATDLAWVSGSGPRGRIQAADVEAAVSFRVTAPAPVAMGATAQVIREMPAPAVRHTIAQRFAASHKDAARVTLITEADATRLAEARTQLGATVREEGGLAPDYGDWLVLIVARGLREFPQMNARLSSDGTGGDGSLMIEQLPCVNLGLAVDTDDGLLVPVIHDADRKGLRAIAGETHALIERAQAGRAQPDDLRGGTFTISDLSMYDIDAFTPIINLAETAILGAGRIQSKAIVLDGEIRVRQMWTLSLAFDHRLVDGAPAACFLQRIKELVENPVLLLAES